MNGHTEDWHGATRVANTTGGAPPIAERDSNDGTPLGFPRPGDTLADFEIIRILGRGSFACVYLARQVSLGRLVALKVLANRGQEARMLARMDHGNIVRVFSESIDPGRDLHLICMQYVPGGTLEGVIRHLRRLPPEQRGGEAILGFLDSLPGDAPALDLAALRERELLGTLGHAEAACWMGARLAEALAHAHALGILHRDIKPANVLMSRYGQPLLADFNVSRADDAGPDGMAGTLAYMAPEHIDAFRLGRGSTTPREAADLYSLGVLLHELYTGELPQPLPEGLPLRETLERIAEIRRRPPPPMPGPPDVGRLVARCLAPAPEDRPASAAEMAAALDSARELHRARRELPRGGLLTRWAVASPLLFALLLIPLVHVMATVVNVTYNALRLVSPLSEEQRRLFPLLVLAYNAIAWPVCLTMFLGPVMRVYRAWSAMARPGPVDARAVEAARREALTLPGLLARYSCLGWLPGGVLFPLALSVLQPLRLYTWGQFLFSFTVSGLIAIVYSVLLMQLLVLRVLYPALWPDARGLRATARKELASVESRLAWLQMLAVLIPLAGAALLVGVGPEQVEQGYAVFRLLVAALLAAGMFGLGLAVLVAAELRRVVAALVGERSLD